VQNQVFKIVADQAANNKKAFGLEKENDKNDELVKMTKDLLAKQKKEDLQIKQLDWEKDYEQERQKWN
jgi:poly-gamma-glutamate capsule biosynthesis protein CapA/YwtB (metallophosphatase superfamily)